MNGRYERRSKEAPMDFEWTNKDRDVIPPNSPFKPAKRSHTDMAAPNIPFTQHNPSTPTFGANCNVPFMFNQPRPNFTPVHPWTPPSRTVPQGPEICDVAMRDASPPKSLEPNYTSNVRAVATGAMRRVFRARQKHGSTSRSLVSGRRRIEHNEGDSEESDEEGLAETDQIEEMGAPQTKRRGFRKSYSEPVKTTASHNHHYTLHMQTPQLSHSDIPYLLLGYLQFFFNLCLVSGFLYIAFHFLRAVQKDVEQKMAEFTLDSLHEIRACARQYEENFCGGRPSPIIVQQCQEWKLCMERDVSIAGRTRLFAELVGEVINGFMEPITWRSLVFTLTSFSMGIALVNALLVFYRGRHAPIGVQSTPQSQSPSFPIYGVGSPMPYWGNQSSPAPLFRPSTPGGALGGTLRTSNVEAEDGMEARSRRRRIDKEDTAESR